MGVVIEICAKHPGGPTRITVADISYNIFFKAETTGVIIGICVKYLGGRSVF